MSNDDADRLGPKGHIYVELVREQWRAPLERGGARRAIVTALLSVLVIALGVIGMFRMTGESVFLIAIGAVALYSTLGELRPLRPEFEEARRIGWVEPSLDDSRVTLGEPATFRAVLHPRRALMLQNVTVTAEARRWTRAEPGEVLLSMPLPVSLTGGPIDPREDWRQSVTFRIPGSAPASWYTSTESVRWTIAMHLTFAGQAPWQRTWPMLVFPADTP